MCFEMFVIKVHPGVVNQNLTTDIRQGLGEMCFKYQIYLSNTTQHKKNFCKILSKLGQGQCVVYFNTCARPVCTVLLP